MSSSVNRFSHLKGVLSGAIANGAKAGGSLEQLALTTASKGVRGVAGPSPASTALVAYRSANPKTEATPAIEIGTVVALDDRFSVGVQGIHDGRNPGMNIRDGISMLAKLGKPGGVVAGYEDLKEQMFTLGGDFEIIPVPDFTGQMWEESIRGGKAVFSAWSLVFFPMVFRVVLGIDFKKNDFITMMEVFFGDLSRINDVQIITWYAIEELMCEKVTSSAKVFLLPSVNKSANSVFIGARKMICPIIESMVLEMTQVMPVADFSAEIAEQLELVGLAVGVAMSNMKDKVDDAAKERLRTKKHIQDMRDAHAKSLESRTDATALAIEFRSFMAGEIECAGVDNDESIQASIEDEVVVDEAKKPAPPTDRPAAAAAVTGSRPLPRNAVIKPLNVAKAITAAVEVVPAVQMSARGGGSAPSSRAKRSLEDLREEEAPGASMKSPRTITSSRPVSAGGAAEMLALEAQKFEELRSIVVGEANENGDDPIISDDDGSSDEEGQVKDSDREEGQVDCA
jgi:hypothetical protein